MASPNLRFKEFDGDWSAVTLEHLAEVERGKFSVRPRNDPRYFGGEMPFVQTGDVTGSGVYLKGFSQTLNEDGIRVSKVFPEDTILITIAANIGDTTITQYPVACPDSVVAIQPNKTLTNSIFLKNIIDLQKDNLDSQATQNAQKNINLQVLKPLELIVPELKEQTKIASFLSAVDEKISQLTQKHELLSQYKQGMMQKLFSQQIRFKADDGSEFEEWKETTLGQTGKFVGGGTPSKENNEFWQGSIPWISSSDLVEESIFKINISRFISENALNQSATKLVPANSILIVSRVGVGKVAITPYEICTSQDFTSLALADGNSIFFAYLIKSLTPYLLEMNQGTSIKGFVKEDLSNLEIQVPCLEEQTKIANFLSTIDQKIEVVAQQIEHAKTWKKGLLQQMFV